MGRIETYDTVTNLLEHCPDGMNLVIANAFIKGWGFIHRRYKKIMVSISGGADSDIMIDIIERIGHPLAEVHYVFYDTGLEFHATKEHLPYLEQRYGITIERFDAKIPVPLGVKKYGVPFLSKRVSTYIHRLQKHGFRWEDESFESLYAKYPNCKSALKWWCNEWGAESRLNIRWNKGLKEFLLTHPPQFLISDGCCDGAKKSTANLAEKIFNPDLNCQGIRKAEGGRRATAYKSCFDGMQYGCDKYRPIFWFKDEDKKIYEKMFQIRHSDCYSVYGLKRTGCACCPFGKNHQNELKAAHDYEPKLYRAAMNIFGKSYEYTDEYHRFQEAQKA